MSTVTRSVDAARLGAADLLHRIAQDLDNGLALVDDNGPVLIRVALRADNVEVAILPIDGHPGEALWGFHAPAEWWALGIRGTGWATPVELLSSADAPNDVEGPDRRRVRVLHLVSRTGDSVTVHRTNGVPPDLPTSTREPGRGLLDDCCRRALGLPTTAPPPSTIDVWTAQWLDAIIAAVLRGALHDVTWSQLVARHPAVRAITRLDGDPRLRDWAERALVRAGELFAGEYTWPRLLAMQRSGRGTVTDLAPRIAAWMDEGIFARTVLASVTPADEALESMGELLPAHHVERIVDTLRHWGTSLDAPWFVPEGTADDDQ